MRDYTSAIDNFLTTSKKVPGNGNRFATELWLDSRDMSSLRSADLHKDRETSVTISFNEFETYFDTSANYVKLEPGRHTTIRIKAVQHVASNAFKKEDVQSRKCRFPHENPGLQSSDVWPVSIGSVLLQMRTPFSRGTARKDASLNAA